MDMQAMPQQQPAEGAEDPKAMLQQCMELLQKAMAAMGGEAEGSDQMMRKQIAGEVFGGKGGY